MIFWIILTNQGYVESVQRHFVPCKLFSEYFFLSCRLVRQCSCTYFSLDSKSFFFITNLVGLWSLFHWIFCLLFCLAFLFMNNNATSISFSKKKKRKKKMCRNIKRQDNFFQAKIGKKFNMEIFWLVLFFMLYYILHQ